MAKLGKTYNVSMNGSRKTASGKTKPVVRLSLTKAAGRRKSSGGSGG